jgi:hypothetical protein
VNNLLPIRTSSYVLAASLLLGSAISSGGQSERTLVAGDGQVAHDVPVPHPLAWWTHDPLQLDESGDLLIGPKADGGDVLTARDYQVQQKVTTLGTIADHRIVQVLTTIHAGPRVATFGGPAVDGPPAQWKSLLVGVGANRYVEIYGLQSNWGLYKIGSAGIYGSGASSILGTDDPDGGNGGGCSDGYWWFDKAGAHPVDFTKLEDAIRRAIPKEGTYTPSCSALHPAEAYLESGVQRLDAKCHACGGLGTVHARYRIQSGVAIPVSVRFEANTEQEE